MLCLAAHTERCAVSQPPRKEGQREEGVEEADEHLLTLQQLAQLQHAARQQRVRVRGRHGAGAKGMGREREREKGRKRERGRKSGWECCPFSQRCPSLSSLVPATGRTDASFLRTWTRAMRNGGATAHRGRGRERGRRGGKWNGGNRHPDERLERENKHKLPSLSFSLFASSLKGGHSRLKFAHIGGAQFLCGERRAQERERRWRGKGDDVIKDALLFSSLFASVYRAHTYSLSFAHSLSHRNTQSIWRMLSMALRRDSSRELLHAKRGKGCVNHRAFSVRQPSFREFQRPSF